MRSPLSPPARRPRVWLPALIVGGVLALAAVSGSWGVVAAAGVAVLFMVVSERFGLTPRRHHPEAEKGMGLRWWVALWLVPLVVLPAALVALSLGVNWAAWVSAAAVCLVTVGWFAGSVLDS